MAFLCLPFITINHTAYILTEDNNKFAGFEIKTLIKLHLMIGAEGGVDRTALLLQSAALIQAFEHELAVAFGKKLCWFESHYRHISLRSPGS